MVDGEGECENEGGPKVQDVSTTTERGIRTRVHPCPSPSLLQMQMQMICAFRSSHPLAIGLIVDCPGRRYCPSRSMPVPGDDAPTDHQEHQTQSTDHHRFAKMDLNDHRIVKFE